MVPFGGFAHAAGRGLRNCQWDEFSIGHVDHDARSVKPIAFLIHDEAEGGGLSVQISSPSMSLQERPKRASPSSR